MPTSRSPFVRPAEPPFGALAVLAIVLVSLVLGIGAVGTFIGSKYQSRGFAIACCTAQLVVMVVAAIEFLIWLDQRRRDRGLRFGPRLPFELAAAVGLRHALVVLWLGSVVASFALVRCAMILPLPTMAIFGITVLGGTTTVLLIVAVERKQPTHLMPTTTVAVIPSRQGAPIPDAIARPYRTHRALAWVGATLVCATALAPLAGALTSDFVVHGRTAQSEVAAWLTGVELALQLLAIITFLGWLTGVYRNLPALGSTSTRTATWAVVWWFIPPVNVAHAFTVMRLAWLESQPRPSHNHEGRPIVRSTALIACWWAMLLLSYLVITRTTVRAAIDDPDSLRSAGVFAYSLPRLVAAALCAVMMLMIEARQRAQRDDLVRRAAPVERPHDRVL